MLQHHPHFAHGLLDLDAPFKAVKVAELKENLRPNAMGHLIDKGILVVVKRESQRRHEYDGSNREVSGGTYRVAPDAAGYISENVADPGDRKGWCADPDCGRQSIQNDGEPRCKCGAPIRREVVQ